MNEDSLSPERAAIPYRIRESMEKEAERGRALTAMFKRQDEDRRRQGLPPSDTITGFVS